MIEIKSLRSKIFDILNLVILIAITLICIVPVWLSLIHILCDSGTMCKLCLSGKR